MLRVHDHGALRGEVLEQREELCIDVFAGRVHRHEQAEDLLVEHDGGDRDLPYAEGIGEQRVDAEIARAVVADLHPVQPQGVAENRGAVFEAQALAVVHLGGATGGEHGVVLVVDHFEHSRAFGGEEIARHVGESGEQFVTGKRPSAEVTRELGEPREHADHVSRRERRVLVAFVAVRRAHRGGAETGRTLARIVARPPWGATVCVSAPWIPYTGRRARAIGSLPRSAVGYLRCASATARSISARCCRYSSFCVAS